MMEIVQLESRADGGVYRTQPTTSSNPRFVARRDGMLVFGVRDEATDVVSVAEIPADSISERQLEEILVRLECCLRSVQSYPSEERA